MSAASDLTLHPDLSVSASPRPDATERAAIDASTRGPVMFFFTSAIFWLILGTLVALLASVKLHWASFLDDGNVS